MKMEIVLSKLKAETLGYTVETCYEVVDRIFAKYGIAPESQGVYRGPNVQNTYNACAAALIRLPKSSWFLKLVEEWYWYVGSDDVSDREDCLADYYAFQRGANI